MKHINLESSSGKIRELLYLLEGETVKIYCKFKGKPFVKIIKCISNGDEE